MGRRPFGARAVVAACIISSGLLAAWGATVVNAQGAATGPEVLPSTTADPGSNLTVRSRTGGECQPTEATPYVSVEVIDGTMAVQSPTTSDVNASGAWSAGVHLGADLAPKTYQLRTTCRYNDPSVSGPYFTYPDVALTVREQRPGQARLSSPVATRGANIQVGAGAGPCPPPVGAAGPAVRVSLVDDRNIIRSETQGSVDTQGRWGVTLTVAGIEGDRATVLAVCSASTAARAPYARYTAASLAVVDPPTTSTSSTTTVSSTTLLQPGSVDPAASTTTTSTTAVIPTSTTLAPSSVAAPVHAEPSYTG